MDSLPANLLVLPAQPAVMMTGGLAALAGMALPQVGQVAGWVAWVFLAYTTQVVELLAAVPGASVPVPLGIAGLGGIFLFIGVATVAARRSEVARDVIVSPVRTRFASLALLGASPDPIALLAGLWATSQPDGMLHVSFLDVGQGDAILIEGPNGRQMLIDGGRYPTAAITRWMGAHPSGIAFAGCRGGDTG
ncbi:MAG: ComEC/Rec2 family competence protein [Chloroflexota bacterium]